MTHKKTGIEITEDVAVNMMKRCLETKMPHSATQDLFTDPNICRLFFKRRWVLFLWWHGKEFEIRLYPPKNIKSGLPLK